MARRPTRPAAARCRRAGRARALLAGALLVPALALGACAGGDTVAEQARDGSGKGYVAGDGTVEQLAPDQRAEPVQLSGPLLDGSPWSMDRARGQVLVVNVWGSWCEPCEREAPHLVEAAKRLGKPGDVQFLGIDVGESAETGAAGAKRWGLPYPSLSDPDRATGVVLQNKAQATPTTLVIDRQGRIAARISGELTSPGTLDDLVQDVAAEHA